MDSKVIELSSKFSRIKFLFDWPNDMKSCFMCHLKKIMTLLYICWYFYLWQINWTSTHIFRSYEICGTSMYHIMVALGIENNDVIENTKSIIIRKQTNRQKICRLYWPSLVFEFRQTLSPFKQCHRLYLCLPCLCLIIFIEYLKNSYNLFFEVLLVNQPIVNFVWMVYQVGWENKMWVVQMIYNMSN